MEFGLWFSRTVFEKKCCRFWNLCKRTSTFDQFRFCCHWKWSETFFSSRVWSRNEIDWQKKNSLGFRLPKRRNSGPNTNLYVFFQFILYFKSTKALIIQSDNCNEILGHNKFHSVFKSIFSKFLHLQRTWNWIIHKGYLLRTYLIRLAFELWNNLSKDDTCIVLTIAYIIKKVFLQSTQKM